ncbi:MAG: cation:proton antiporter, partial [Bacteroidota bacterium]
MALCLIKDHLTFPLQEPVLIFSVVLFVILFSPIILGRLKIPGIIGLILAGVALGPNGLHILENDSSFKLFGFVGLLYIMFLAGLDLDLNEFKKNRNKSIVFGFLTFAIPLSTGIYVFYGILGYPILPALLIASMFSTHTLVGYPIVGRFGITRNLSVNIAVGGTIITDTAVLLMLAVITGTVDGNLDSMFWTRMCISIAVFFFVVFYVFPRISRWFFKNIKDDNTSHYIFVMAMVFLAAFLVEIAQIEPIVGAFMAGLSLNRLIPQASALHGKIEFVGNALFIPFFLISVGMLVDLRVLLDGNQALIFAGIITGIALLTKWLAAWATQLIYKLSKAQRQLIFGLSSAHA